jgi:predicted P-loop ATPase
MIILGLLNQETIKSSSLDKINELENIIKLNNIEKDNYLKEKQYYNELENKLALNDEECIRLKSELSILKEITVVSSVVQDQEKKYSNMLDDAKIQIEGLRRINDIIVGQNLSLGISLFN